MLKEKYYDCVKTKVLLFTVVAGMSVSCLAEKDYPIAENNRIINGIIPMSRTLMPEDVKDEAQKKEAYVLSFFKTPQQQLMPLGFFAMAEDMKNVEVLRNIRSCGINLVHCYGVGSFNYASDYLKAAREAGIGVLQNLPASYMKNKSPQWLRNGIREIAQDQQLLYWYLPEESQPGDLENLQILADIIRSEDLLKRPVTTFVESGQDTHWQNVSKIVDAMILGVYPSSFKHPAPRADIRRYIDLAYQLRIPVVFSAVEAYKDKKADHWPTSKEVRFDAYLNLISGSKGLFWYGHAYLKENPELFDAVLKIAHELNGPARLGEVFLAGQRLDFIECRLMQGSAYAPPACAYQKDWWKKEKHIYSSIQWLALKHDNAITIFAVNMNEKVGAADNGGKDYAVTVKFSNLPANITNATVLLEDRQLVLENNSFTDTFEPIGTHIYRFEVRDDF